MAYRFGWIDQLNLCGLGRRILPAIVAVAVAGVAGAQDDALARHAIISALTKNDEGLQQAYWTASQARSNAQTASGASLDEAIFYLYNSTRDSREEFLQGQEILAANARDRDWRNRVLLSLLTDEVYELNRLEGQNRFNKYTRIFNRVSTSLSQLIMLQPQAAASLLWDGMYSLRKGQAATIKERKMVYLCEQFLKKYPDAPERAEVVALHNELKTKMIADRAKALEASGRAAMMDGKFQVAEWHLEKASLLKPEDAETRQLTEQARTLRNRVDEVRGLTLGVSDAEARMTPEQAAAVGRISRALVTGDIATLDSLRHNVPHVWDSVDYAYAAISEKSGDHGAAIVRLQNVASAAPASPGGRAATKLLDNPNFNLSESYRTALADMASEKTKFIWTGRRSREETVYVTGSATIQSAGNPVAVPVLFGLDAAVRAISEKFRTQVSVDGVLDAGARYLRRYPDTAQSREIAAQLAELSKKSGDYDRSLEYLEESGGGSPEDVAKLRENQAIALYEQAKTSGDLLARKRLLDKLMSEYGDSRIAQKSGGKEQAKLPPSLAGDTIVLPGSALGNDPRLAQYLGVPHYLVDGKNGNGEVTPEGISITPSANAVEFKIRNEESWRRGALLTEGREWVLTAARQLRSDYMKTEESRQALYRQKLPFAIEGGAGSGGVDIAPQILPYPTSPLDQQRFD